MAQCAADGDSSDGKASAAIAKCTGGSARLGGAVWYAAEGAGLPDVCIAATIGVRDDEVECIGEAAGEKYSDGASESSPFDAVSSSDSGSSSMSSHACCRQRSHLPALVLLLAGAEPHRRQRAGRRHRLRSIACYGGCSNR